MRKVHENLIIAGLVALMLGSIYFAFNYLTERKQNNEREFSLFIRRRVVNNYKNVDGRAVGVYRVIGLRDLSVYGDVGPDMNEYRRKSFEENTRRISERLREGR